MKDIEKIKSEDLAAQVQDANPANFAIEQEVAAMVGATVPQPTAPSADDARELGAQLLVFLRRALTPIQTALRTAVAAIYAHLDSRCTAYTPAAYAPFRLPAGPYDPMRPFAPRTLPNLLTAITAFSDRKIVSIGVPDGLGIMQLMSSKPSAITAIGDDMVYDLCYYPQLSNLIAALPSLNEINIHCKRMTGFGYTGGARWFPATITKINGKTNELYLPDLERMEESAYSALPSENRDFKVWNFPAMKYCRCSFWNGSAGCDWVEEILMDNMQEMGGYACDPFALNFTAVKKIVWGNVRYNWFNESSFYNGCVNLIDLEFGANGVLMNRNINLTNWNPTNALSSSASDLVADPTAHPTWNNLDQFLQNFREHIALRLTANGSGKTLTLSQAVFSAVIEGSSPICDDIKGIIVEKGWQVKDTNNIIFPT